MKLQTVHKCQQGLNKYNLFNTSAKKRDTIGTILLIQLRVYNVFGTKVMEYK
jgi:hypothetical protein